MTFIYYMICFLAVVSIVLYATWLLIQKTRRGEGKRSSFIEWLRNIFEAFWGL